MERSDRVCLLGHMNYGLVIILHRTLGADNLIRSLIHQLKLVTMNDECNGVT
jgi:hypothetical protein